MWPVRRPTNDLEAVFKQCVSASHEPSRSMLLAALPEVLDAEKAYEDAATNSTIHLLMESDFQSRFPKMHAMNSNEELKNTYTSRFSGKKSAGYSVYLQLVNSETICPLCGHRPTGSLDHVLPKASYPMLAVTPINLVPSCVKCNGSKLEKVAKKEEDVLLNPYFDDVDDDEWLVAEVIETRPLGVRFLIDPPSHWNLIMVARVKNHFKSFGLANLYAVEVARILIPFQASLKRHGRDFGSDGVSRFLKEMSDGHRSAHRNTWQGALFQALSESDWYCSGGYLL